MPHRRQQQRDQGFTLIELLVVIIILGLLVGIAIPVFLNQRQKGYDAQAKSDLRNVATLQESYLTANGSYAMTISDACSVTPGVLCYRRSNHTTLINGSFVDLTGAMTSAPGNALYGYCLWTYADSEKYWYYNSLRGGLQGNTSC